MPLETRGPKKPSSHNTSRMIMIVSSMYFSPFL
jgi:hypothetical protein